MGMYMGKSVHFLDQQGLRRQHGVYQSSTVAPTWNLSRE
jgi:hypothetical protein